MIEKEIIKELIRKANLRQVEFAEKTGISKQGVNKIYKGTWCPKMPKLQKIAQALGYTIKIKSSYRILKNIEE